MQETSDITNTASYRNALLARLGQQRDTLDGVASLIRVGEYERAIHKITETKAGLDTVRDDLLPAARANRACG